MGKNPVLDGQETGAAVVPQLMVVTKLLMAFAEAKPLGNCCAIAANTLACAPVSRRYRVSVESK